MSLFRKEGVVPKRVSLLVLERVRVDYWHLTLHINLGEQKASGLNSAKLGSAEPTFSLEAPE